MFFLQITLEIDWYFLIVDSQTNTRGLPASLFATSLPPLARVTLDPSLQARENVNIKKNISYSWNHQKNFSMFLAWRIIHDDFLYDSFFFIILGNFLELQISTEVARIQLILNSILTRLRAYISIFLFPALRPF